MCMKHDMHSVQSMHKDRVLRKKEKVQKLRAEISAVEKASGVMTRTGEKVRAK